MLRTLPFVAVRQEQGQAAQASPLGLAGGNELVDDDLCAIDEIAELGLPDGQRTRFGRSVAILEPEYGFFRQQRVDYGHAPGIFGQLAQRQQGLTVGLVVQHGMAVEKVPRPESWPTKRRPKPVSIRVA